MAANVDPTAAGAAAGVTLPSSMSFDSTLGSLLVGGLAAVALVFSLGSSVSLANADRAVSQSVGSHQRPDFQLFLERIERPTIIQVTGEFQEQTSMLPTN